MRPHANLYGNLRKGVNKMAFGNDNRVSQDEYVTQMIGDAKYQLVVNRTLEMILDDPELGKEVQADVFFEYGTDRANQYVRTQALTDIVRNILERSVDFYTNRVPEEFALPTVLQPFYDATPWLQEFREIHLPERFNEGRAVLRAFCECILSILNGLDGVASVEEHVAKLKSMSDGDWESAYGSIDARPTTDDDWLLFCANQRIMLGSGVFTI